MDRYPQYMFDLGLPTPGLPTFLLSALRTLKCEPTPGIALSLQLCVMGHYPQLHDPGLGLLTPALDYLLFV